MAVTGNSGFGRSLVDLTFYKCDSTTMFADCISYSILLVCPCHLYVAVLVSICLCISSLYKWHSPLPSSVVKFLWFCNQIQNSRLTYLLVYVQPVCVCMHYVFVICAVCAEYRRCISHSWRVLSQSSSRHVRSPDIWPGLLSSLCVMLLSVTLWRAVWFKFQFLI